MSNTIDVVEQCNAATQELFSFKVISQFIDVKLTYQHSGRKASELTIIRTSKEAAACLRGTFDLGQIALREEFCFLILNRGGRLIATIKLSTGGTYHTIVDIKIILMYLIAFNAQSVVICHNHPSGNLLPSSADLDLTAKFKHACGLLDIRFMDHLILSPEEGHYYSFADEGAL